MANPGPDSFDAQLDAARAGDRSAWEQLYRNHAPSVLGYLRSQRIAQPEDVLAEVWLQVVRDLVRFAGDDAAFRGWILRIAHNRVVDAHRSSSRRVDEVVVADVPEQQDIDPELDVGAAENLELLFDGLPATQRAVLYLRYVLDLPQGEIASVLGMTIAAVKMQQRRGIDAIATKLEKGVDQ